MKLSWTWIVAAVVASWAAVALVPSEAMAGPKKGPLLKLKEAMPPCAEGAEHCFGVRLHVVFKRKKPVVSAKWLARQMNEANARFADTKIGFEVVDVRRVHAGMEVMRTRKDRDRLGQGRFKRGVIDVFVVGQLDNVDAPGEINGVHWRNRDNRQQRWIILSKIAWHVTLAHELGHFFGLPHSDYPGSIMNKSRKRDERPPEDEWAFHDDEEAIIEKRRLRMTRSGYIKPVEP